MAKTLMGLSQELAEAVEASQQAVVRVEGRRRLPASGILWSEDGWIVTANHVLRRDDRLRVGLPTGESVEAELAGRDPLRDLALLKIAPVTMHEVQRLESSHARVGHLVLALGRPRDDIMATLGVISAMGGQSDLEASSRSDRTLQTDVVMYPGFSGGPLVSAAGGILGMNSSGLMRGASLALPVERIDRTVAALIEHGHVRQGYLGVSLQPVRISEASKGDLEQDTGLMVVAVEADGPAQKAGVLQGDVLVSIGKAELLSLDQLFFALADDRIGQQVSLKVLRAGKLIELHVAIGEREA
jgi:S1-C subfamily serine protease